MLIVSGGGVDSTIVNGFAEYTSSTETWTRGSSAWTPAADLPSRRYGLRGVTIGGNFIVTGEHVIT